MKDKYYFLKIKDPRFRDILEGDKTTESQKSQDGGIIVPCKCDWNENTPLFCRSSCGTTTMIEGHSGTGKTILACELCCTTLQKLENEILEKQQKSDVYGVFYSLDQSGNTIKKLMEDFNFLEVSRIQTFSSEDEFSTVDEKLLYIREVRNISNLSQLLGNLEKDLKSQPKYPSIIVIDTVNKVIKFNVEYRKELQNLVDFPKWKGDTCPQMYSPIAKIITFEKGDEETPQEEHLCDCVLELKKRSGTNPIRTMDIVKSRSQKSFFSEHEFEIIKGEGIKVYPSLHTWSKKIEEVSPAVGQKTNFGIPNYFLQNINEPQHKVTNKRSTKKLQISSGITLLWGDPGTFKTWIGVNFLKPFITKDCFETDNAIFISFKISQPAVEYFRNQIFRYRTKENKKTKLGKKYKIKIFPATDPFESPASVFLRIKTQIDKLTANYPDDQPINKRFRAVVFGLHRLSQIPAYKNMEWEFLEVLVKYLKNKKILTLLIDWPDHIESQQENPPMAVDLCANVIKTKIESTTEQQNDGNSESKKLVKISIDRRDYHICNEAYYLKSDNREPF